jgi:hypothetical protein
VRRCCRHRHHPTNIILILIGIIIFIIINDPPPHVPGNRKVCEVCFTSFPLRPPKYAQDLLRIRPAAPLSLAAHRDPQWHRSYRARQEWGEELARKVSSESTANLRESS